MKHYNCKHGMPFGNCCTPPEKKGGPGGVVLGKGINYKNELTLVFQIVDTNDKPLVFMDLTKDEALGLSEQIKEAVHAIWGR